MRKLLTVICALVFCMGIKAQDFSSSTSTQTLQDQTMVFKYEQNDEQYTTLTLWGQGTGLGAAIQMVDLNKSPNPKTLEFTYEIVNFNTIHLLVDGRLFMLVKLHNDSAYLYYADQEKLILKLPRKI